MKGLWVLSLAVGMAAGAAGCGSSATTCSEAGCVSTDDGGATGDGPQLWGLSRGMNNYVVTAISDLHDGCMIGPQGAVNATPLPATYDETTRVFTLGSTVGSPQMPSLGSGTVGTSVANMATLMRENDVMDPSGCTWRQKDVSNMQLFDHDKFTLAVREDQSMFTNTAKCNPPPPSSGSCTSTWTWTLQKQ